MKYLSLQDWIETTNKQLPLSESDSNKVYDLESWITEGKIVSLDSTVFTPSSLEELTEMGLIEQ